MPERDRKRPARRHRWRIALIALVLLGGTAALALRYYTRPDQLTALLVAQVQSAVGADLVINGKASFGFFPELRVSLPHPTLKAHGTSVTVLRADALEAVVPWHTLWASHYDIKRVDLIKPNLDLDALQALLAARPPTSTAPPDVRFALRVEDGTVTSSGKTIAQGLNMAFANSGDLAAWLQNVDAGALLPPLSGSADAATLQFGSTRLDDVHIDVRGDATKPIPSNQP